MNIVHLSGNIGKDAEIHNGDNFKVAQFSIATSESYKNKQGERTTITDWHNIKCFGKLADFCETWVKKGSKFIVHGKLKTEKYENKNGETKYNIFVLADSIEFNGGEKTEKSEPKQSTVAHDADFDLPADAESDNSPF